MTPAGSSRCVWTHLPLPGRCGVRHGVQILVTVVITKLSACAFTGSKCVTEETIRLHSDMCCTFLNTGNGRCVVPGECWHNQFAQEYVGQSYVLPTYSLYVFEAFHAALVAAAHAAMGGDACCCCCCCCCLLLLPLRLMQLPSCT
jgi:hypothetical protein